MDARDTLPRLVWRRAHEMPEDTALISVEQSAASWSQLWLAARQWGAWLSSHGVVSGDKVVTLIPQSLEANYFWMGCCALGAVEVSVNCEFRGEWLRHALLTSGASTVVLSRRFADQLMQVLDGSGITQVLIHDEDLPHASGNSLPDIEPDLHPHNLACVLYTSGTTGQSKAAQVTWAQMHMTWFAGIGFQRDTPQTYYFPYAPCHLAGRGALYRAALTGGRSVIREVFSTTSFWYDVRTRGCTWALLYASPTRFLANLPAQPDDADNPLELVLMCPIPRDADALKRRFGFEAYSVYGMTEVGAPFLVAPQDTTSASTGCCGKPVDAVQAMLADANDYPVSAGETGELLLRSHEPWLFTPGYLGASEASARIWRNGWFHTGDLFRLDASGNYFYQDRAKDMIRRRGENISSFELEAAVLSHPSVQEAAAVALASSVGDEDVLVAVVPRAGQVVDAGQLITYLRDIVPRFAVPRYVRVVPALPKTLVTMRVQKQAIRTEGVTPDTWDQATGLMAAATSPAPR